MKRLFLFFSMVFAAVANCAQLDIAVKGKAPDYTIVIAKDAHAAYKSAAKEFGDFVEQITGGRLPQADDSGSLPAKAVLIGPSKFSQQLLGEKYAFDKMDEDSFLLKAVGPHVVVLGKKRGGQYGVYELLERFGGCRWYASWHSVIPKADKFSVPSDLDDFQKPAFIMREPFWYDMFRTMQALRNKCNGNRMELKEEHGGKIRFGGGQFVHTFGRLVPLAKYWDTHPEYYSEINGKRIKDRTQLCLSNPDVLQIVTATVKDWIRKTPDATIFSVSQNDWYNACQCANCKAIKEQYGTESGVMVWFVNQVAEAVEKEFPNVLIETLAYQYTREPPKNIVPRRNVLPRLCTIELDFAHDIYNSNCDENVKFRKDLETWSAISKQLYIWDYVTDFTHYLAPYPNFYSLQGNAKAFRDNHVIGVMSEGAFHADHADFAELKGWILAKLLWNPDLDVMALLDDFMNGYYGKGAPYVRQYFDELHDRVKDPNFKLATFTDVNNGYLTDEFLIHAQDLWEKAIAAVKDDPIYLYNVKKGAMTVYYTQLARLNRITPSYEWTDTAIKFDTNSQRVGNLAVKFLDCAEPVGGRIVYLASGQGMNSEFFQYCRRFIADKPVFSVKSNGMKLTMAPGLGGTAGILADAKGHNYLSGRNGGMVFAECPANSVAMSQCSLLQKTENGFVFEEAFGKDGKMTGRLTLADGSLRGDYEVRGGKTSITEPRRFSVSLNLGNDANLCWRVVNAKWTECVVPTKDLAGFFTIDIQDPSKGIEIASPKTGRGVRLSFANDVPKFLSLVVYPEAGDAMVSTLSSSEIPAGDSRTTSVVLMPLEKVAGLPATKPFVKSDKVRLLFEENDVKIAKNTWGGYVADAKAGDGRAAMLYNTHYQWCVRVNPDFSKLTPGVEYAIRFRIRVDRKPDMKGEAFWAGLYSKTRKKDIGMIAPKVTAMDGEYHWYTTAKWIPDLKEDVIVWAGPGRFTDGKTSINGVYIDRVEFVPADEIE